MGDRKFAFSHDGFDTRLKDMPFPKQCAGENLALRGNVPKNEIAKVK